MNVNVMSEGEGEGKEVKLVGTTAAAFVGIRSNGILLQVQISRQFLLLPLYPIVAQGKRAVKTLIKRSDLSTGYLAVVPVCLVTCHCYLDLRDEAVNFLCTSSIRMLTK